VVPVAIVLSLLHLLNFLNYTVLNDLLNLPAARSALLVAFALALIVRSSGNLAFHAQRCWDMYAICSLAMLSALWSSDPERTLKYASWLLLCVYVGTELAARIRSPSDMAASLAIVLLPASFFVAVTNIVLGPTVAVTGRHFGALGSAHVDTAHAMNFICLFLALRSIPVDTSPLPKWLRWVMWGVLAWALYQAVFGLTRSIWLGSLLALGLYVFRHSLRLKSLLIMLCLVVVIVVTIDYVGIDRVLPEEVKGRIEVTEQRYKTGQIDPRIRGIRLAWATAWKQPQGTGYAVASSHNSYLNMLLNLGWIGFVLALVAIARSALYVLRNGIRWTLFFAIGCAALLLHAFFEVQTLPGQANFVALLLWYALSRSRFAVQPTRSVAPPRARHRFVSS
jgi:hypothetical protein